MFYDQNKAGAERLLGLDIVDWSMLLVSIVLIGLIVMLSLPNAHADGTSVYTAGNGKYCKESAVKGYLDCFYASLDACQKRNKSPDMKCVANPNSGT